jgi:malto-oligosyltrehalose trehalohydrolase
VLLFAPDSVYGTPDELKDLIQTAHHKGLMVFLDVVYNHFGPEGNYLHTYAPAFFAGQHHTPWGAGINFDGAGSQAVRQFFIHNALYWLEEYHLDGLRLDSAHAMQDGGSPHVLEELAAAVNAGPGQERHVHLVLENDHNAAHYLTRQPSGQLHHYVAQWNDDTHHSLHLLLTGETDGYYADYAARPTWYLGRCLAEGFGYQGEASGYRKGTMRGEPSGTLPPTAFVSFLQNHDQVGNRAFGERIHELAEKPAIRAALAVILLAPNPPLLFMGEEFAARAPFQFFCDFGADLGAAVAAGRCREFARFARFTDPVLGETIPDPNAPATFECSKLDWDSLTDAPQRDWLAFYRRLLSVRHEHIIPLVAGMHHGNGRFRQLGERGLWVRWRIGEDRALVLLANLGETTVQAADVDLPAVEPLYVHPPDLTFGVRSYELPPWCVVWFLQGESL